jgi:hypothetical protein
MQLVQDKHPLCNMESQTAHGSNIPRLIDAQVSSAERNELEVFSTTLLHAPIGLIRRCNSFGFRGYLCLGERIEELRVYVFRVNSFVDT